MTNKISKTDFEYGDDGFYFWLIPLNRKAERCWNEMYASIGSEKMPVHWFASIKKQLTDSGYRMRKIRPKNVNTDEILKELLA